MDFELFLDEAKQISNEINDPVPNSNENVLFVREFVFIVFAVTLRIVL